MTTKKSYTLQEAADIIGVSKKTIYRHIKAGNIAIVKPMGTPRIAAEEVERLQSGVARPQ